ncbi:MAG: hypothetical protein RB191_15460 [Terriglobia bacterium]|nr:hypothetical protein [Terriglobia bacterium]
MKTYDDKYDRAACDALAEVLRAKDKWPPFNSAHEGFAVLLEEVDELKAHVWTRQSKRDIKKMRAEAIQVAAMAIAFAAEVCTDQVQDMRIDAQSPEAFQVQPAPITPGVDVLDHLIGEHGRVVPWTSLLPKDPC